ncbi:MAG: hypothetical protein ACRCYQ_08295 [Nocardioides sp.]
MTGRGASRIALATTPASGDLDATGPDTVDAHGSRNDEIHVHHTLITLASEPPRPDWATRVERLYESDGTQLVSWLFKAGIAWSVEIAQCLSVAPDGTTELHPVYVYAADLPDGVTAAQWQELASTAAEVVSIITAAEQATKALAGEVTG